jgi:hypothetical protein
MSTTLSGRYTIEATDRPHVPYVVRSSRATYNLVRFADKPSVMFVAGKGGRMALIEGHDLFTDARGILEPLAVVN